MNSNNNEHKEKDCFELISGIVEQLDILERHVDDVSEFRRLTSSLILGFCPGEKLANTKEEFLSGFNSYDSPFPRIERWFKKK